jgi:hypothetical protein
MHSQLVVPKDCQSVSALTAQAHQAFDSSWGFSLHKRKKGQRIARQQSGERSGRRPGCQSSPYRQTFWSAFLFCQNEPHPARSTET